MKIKRNGMIGGTLSLEIEAETDDERNAFLMWGLTENEGWLKELVTQVEHMLDDWKAKTTISVRERSRVSLCAAEGCTNQGVVGVNHELFCLESGHFDDAIKGVISSYHTALMQDLNKAWKG